MTAPRLDLLALYPEMMDLGADTANLAVLRVRAGWEDIDARVDVLTFGSGLPSARPDVVLLGAGADEDLPVVCEQLLALGEGLREWLAAGTVLLAVGSGLDLLATTWEGDSGERVSGAAVFAGHAQRLPVRASGDLVVDPASGSDDLLVGYENHSRGYVLGPNETALGTARRGVGNGNGNGNEGVLVHSPHGGTAIGTHLHGPMFARNPGFSDTVLTRAMANRHGVGFEAASHEARRADALAARARASVLR